MSTTARPPKEITPSKRRHFDGAALATALRKQHQRDAESEPASLLTIMGAVRLLKPLIDDRRTRGWTDPMIATFFRELGVDISAETLRTYRSRLKQEAANASLAEAAPAARPMDVMPAEQPPLAAPPAIPAAPEARDTQASPSSPSPPTQTAAGTETGANPPRFNTAVDLDDCV